MVIEHAPICFEDVGLADVASLAKDLKVLDLKRQLGIARARLDVIDVDDDSMHRREAACHTPVAIAVESGVTKPYPFRCVVKIDNHGVGAELGEALVTWIPYASPSA